MSNYSASTNATPHHSGMAAEPVDPISGSVPDPWINQSSGADPMRAAGDLQTDEPELKPNTGFFEIVRKYASLADLLRLSGAVAVAVAMGLFLLNGIEVVNDLQRFLTMLGLTAALTAAGLAMSMLLKEQRGSRVFISLALLSVPVNFTVIGALLYSIVPLDAQSLNYPDYAHWQAASIADLAMGLAAGLAVLGPVVWIAFSVLARSSRAWLSAALIAGCAILLVPVRGEIWSACLATGTTLLLWLVCKKYSAGSLAVKTAEGKLAVALLFVAPMIVAVRSLFFYDVNGVLMLALSIGFYIYCRQLRSGRSTAGVMTALLTMLAAGGILAVGVSTLYLLLNVLPESWGLFASAIVLLLLSDDLLRVSPDSKLSGAIGFALSSVSVLAIVVTTAWWPDMTLWVVLALVAIMTFAYWRAAKPLALLGAIGLLALLILNASEMWIYAQSVWSTMLMTGWWGIAAVGAIAIVAGSMIDRAGTIVKIKS